VCIYRRGGVIIGSGWHPGINLEGGWDGGVGGGGYGVGGIFSYEALLALDSNIERVCVRVPVCVFVCVFLCL
jgi:hypothetical protein